MEVLVLALHPMVKDVTQFERLVAKLLTSSLGLTLVDVEYLFLHLWTYLNVVIGALYIVETFPQDRYRRRIIGRTTHLVNVPVGL